MALVNRSLDEKLYYVVTGIQIGYIGRDQIEDLLDAGANPWARVGPENRTTIEIAIDYLNESTFTAFLHPSIDFTPRPSYPDILSLIIKKSIKPMSDETCINIYRRIKVARPSKSKLLYRALKYYRVKLARVLITDRIGLDLPGYYHQCTLLYRDRLNQESDISNVVQALVDSGYRQTGAHMEDDDYLTAMEFAIKNGSTAMITTLLPFAEITFFAFHDLSQSYRNCHYTVSMINQCDLRMLPGIIEGSERDPIILRMIRLFVSNKPVMPLILSSGDEIILRDKYNLGYERSSAEFKLKEKNRIKTELARAFLKQGAEVDPDFQYYPELRDALKPWSEIRHAKYYSYHFNRLVRAFITSARYSPNCQIYLPAEIIFMIINCFDRRVHF